MSFRKYPKIVKSIRNSGQKPRLDLIRIWAVTKFWKTVFVVLNDITSVARFFPKIPVLIFHRKSAWKIGGLYFTGGNLQLLVTPIFKSDSHRNLRQSLTEFRSVASVGNREVLVKSTRDRGPKIATIDLSCWWIQSSLNFEKTFGNLCAMLFPFIYRSFFQNIVERAYVVVKAPEQ